MYIKKKALGFNKNINKHGLIFRYNIRVDILFGIFCGAARQIPCIY